jgi:hypothetical protein
LVKTPNQRLSGHPAKIFRAAVVALPSLGDMLAAREDVKAAVIWDAGLKMVLLKDPILAGLW